MKTMNKLVPQEYSNSMVKIAQSRIRSHLHNFRLYDYDLNKLLVSVYLQGVYDIAETLATNDVVLSTKDSKE